MKNISFLCMLFVAFFAYGQKAWAQFSDGDGTPDNPYLISSANDWDALSSAVSGGTTYSGGYFRLTDDISVTTMLGSSTSKFSGTFDGNGHTLTFNQEATEQYIAPFRYVSNATIENLRVAGTVTSSNKFAGGVVAHATGTNAITNCVNSIVINATISGNGSHGGILGQLGGENNSVAIAGCLSDGKMLGTDTDYWCGLIGYFGSNSVTISNCFFSPQEINVKPTNDNYTICREGAALKNCFYNAEAAEMYSRQGSQAYSIAPDRHVTMRLLGIDYPYYNVSGITIYEDFGHDTRIWNELFRRHRRHQLQ
ncbi:MAG: hypothetical protein K5945_10835 [Bacteroidaceae bacterium]|nr:hypothetical protein [Bacteroidaceae bacterium]